MDVTPPPVPLRSIIFAFFQIGLTAYGMAISGSGLVWIPLLKKKARPHAVS